MDNENQELITLVTDTQNGVEDAFEKLYHKSFRHAYCTASFLLKNEQDIEDVLQNSYMYVSKYINGLENPGSFNNWLGVIVKHECQKYISKQKKLSDVIFLIQKTEDPRLLEGDSLPIDYMEKSELADEIQRIVDNLPLEQRACVFLYYYEQHSVTEISEMLGIVEGTVMSRLYYARKKLEKEFGQLQKRDHSLFGISIIPAVISLFAFRTETAVIPSAMESGVIGAVTAGSAASASVSAATSAAASTTAASTAASTVGTAVAVKVTAVAVAASAVVGAGVVTVNHVKNKTEMAALEITASSAIEEYTTAAIILQESTLPDNSDSESTVVFGSESTLSFLASDSADKTTKGDVTAAETSKENSKQTTLTEAATTSKPTTTKPKEETTTQVSATEKESTTQKAATQKQSTTKKKTTRAPTTKKAPTTRKETTTRAAVTVESTTQAKDYFVVSGGVLSGYTGNESNVTIPSKVGSSTVDSIGTGAFSGNTDITSVSIPSTVTRIGMEAFSDCTNLRSVALPSSLNSIGVAAFYGCSSLTSVNIPDGTKTISDEAFSYCENLSSITVPDSVTNISKDAFYGSDNVTIRCSEGSAAHEYAVANSVDFELI